MTRLPTGCRYTLWLFNSSPWKTAHLKMVYLLKMVISMAMLNYQRVNVELSKFQILMGDVL